MRVLPKEENCTKVCDKGRTCLELITSDEFRIVMNRKEYVFAKNVSFIRGKDGKPVAICRDVFLSDGKKSEEYWLCGL